MPKSEKLELLSTWCDRLTPGGTEFAAVLCVLEAITPTMDEDWLAGIEDGSTQTAAPAVVSGSQSGS
jgi:hypothetical protein